MKKKLDTSLVMNELRGNSVFFPTKQEPPTSEKEVSVSHSSALPPTTPVTLSSIPSSDSKPESQQSSNLASKHASTLALSSEALELIRKIVKNPGKEDVLYIRLSQEEKDKLGDISYTYKRQGIKTSDNEIVRIALNALLEEYKINGENSILAKIIASLHA
jgi:hypothetical protein